MPIIDVHTAAENIKNGELAVFATETVYGLGGDATNDLAVARIYAQKGRPQFNPLIVHFADIENAKMYVEFNKAAETIATAFWPGPLTIILKRKPDCQISKLCSAGGETLAIRLPSHPLAIKLIKAAEKPIAAPSANSSGKISPTSPTHVLDDFGVDFPVLDGGPCEVGLESTVLDLSEDQPRILRPGSITKQMLLEVLGKPIEIGPKSSASKLDMNQTMKSPGLLTSHYAPDKPLMINVEAAQANTFFVGFGPQHPNANFNLSSSGDLVEAASNFFKALHLANKSTFPQIAFATVPEDGIGQAINDRLKRAAAPR